MAHTLYPEPRIGFRRSSQWEMNQWPHLASLYASTHHLDEEGKHPDPMMGQDNVFEPGGDPIGAYKYYVQPSLRSEFSIEEPQYLNRPVYKDGDSRSSGLTSGGDSFRRGATCRVVLCVFLIFCFIVVVIAAVTLAVLLSKSPRKSPSAFAPIETFESSAKFHKFQFIDALKDNSSEEFKKMETEFCNAIKAMFTDHDSPVRLEFHECEVIEFINGSIIAKYRIKLRPRSSEGFKAEERINQKLDEYFAAKVKEEGPWQKVKFNPTFIRGFKQLVFENTMALDIATTITPENATSITGDMNVTIAVVNITAVPDVVTETTRTPTVTAETSESTTRNITTLTDIGTTHSEVFTTLFPTITSPKSEIKAIDNLISIRSTSVAESIPTALVETFTTSVFVHTSSESAQDASTQVMEETIVAEKASVIDRHTQLRTLDETSTASSAFTERSIYSSTQYGSHNFTDKLFGENVTKSTITKLEITDGGWPIPDHTTIISETIKHTTEQPLEKINTSTDAETTTSIEDWPWTTQDDIAISPTTQIIKDEATHIPEILTEATKSLSSSQSVQENITETLGTTRTMNVTQSIVFSTDSNTDMSVDITAETVTRTTEVTILLQNTTQVFAKVENMKLSTAVDSVEQLSQPTPTDFTKTSTKQTTEYTTQTLLSTTAQELTMSTGKKVLVIDAVTSTSTNESGIIPQISTTSPVDGTLDFEVTTDAMAPFTDLSTPIPLIITNETKTDIITRLMRLNATIAVIDSLSIHNEAERFNDTTTSEIRDIDISSVPPLTASTLSPVTSLETTQEMTSTSLLRDATSTPNAVSTDFTQSTIKEKSSPVDQTQTITSEYSQTTSAILAANESTTAGTSNTTSMTDTVTDFELFSGSLSTSVDFQDFFTTDSVGALSLTDKSTGESRIADTNPGTLGYVTTDVVKVRDELSTRSFVEETSTIPTTGTYTSTRNITMHQSVDVVTSKGDFSKTDISQISAGLSTSDMPVLNRTRKEDVDKSLDYWDPSLATDIPIIDEYTRTVGSTEVMKSLQTKEGTPYTDTLITSTSALDILKDNTDQANQTTLATNIIPNITENIAISIANETTSTFTTDTPNTTTGHTDISSDFVVTQTLLVTEKVASSTDNYTGPISNQTTLSLLSTESHMVSESTKHVDHETSTARYVNTTSPLPSKIETATNISEPASTHAVTTGLDLTDYTTSVYSDSSLTATDIWDIGTQGAVINETSETTTISSSADAMNLTSEKTVIETTQSSAIKAATHNFTARFDLNESILSSSEAATEAVTQSVPSPITSESADRQIIITPGTTERISDRSFETTTVVNVSDATINETKHAKISLTSDGNDTTLTQFATTKTYNVSEEMPTSTLAVSQDTIASTSSSASLLKELTSDTPLMFDKPTMQQYTEEMTTVATTSNDLTHKKTTEKVLPLETESKTKTKASFADASSGTTFVSDKETLPTTTLIVPRKTDSTDIVLTDLTSEIPGFTDEPIITTPKMDYTSASADKNISLSRMVIANNSEAVIVVKQVTATVKVPSTTEIMPRTNVFIEPVTVLMHTTQTPLPVLTTVLTQNDTSTTLLDSKSGLIETTETSVKTKEVNTVVDITADIMYSDTYLDYTTVATDYAAVSSLETMVSANPNSSAISVESFITSGHSLEDISNGSLSDNTTTTILDKVKDPSSVSLSGTLTSNDSKLLAENVTARTVSVSPIEQAETNITDETSGTTTGVIDITSDVQSTKIPVQQTISPKKSPSALAPIETFESSARFHTFNFTDVLKDNSSEEFNKMETEFCNAIKDMFTDRDSPVRLEFHECEVIEFMNGSIIAKYRIKLRPRSSEGFEAEEKISQKLDEYFAAKVKEKGPWQKMKFNPTFVRGFKPLFFETTTTFKPENASSITGNMNVPVSPKVQAVTNMTDTSSGITIGVIDIALDVQSTNIPVQQTQSPSTNVTSFTDFVGTTLAGAIKSSTETLVTQELARVVANFTTVEEKIRTTQATVNVPLDQTTSYELLYDFSTSESIFVTDSPVAANESSLTNDSVIPSNVTILKTLTVRENDTVPEIKVNNTLVLSMNNENSSLLTSTVSLQNITSEIKSSTVDSSTVALEIAVAVSDSTTNAAESVTDIRTGAIVVNSQDGVDKVTTEAPILKAQTTTTAPAVKTQASTAAPIVKAPHQTINKEIIYDDWTTESILVTKSPVGAKESSVTNDSVIITNKADVTSNVKILKTSSLLENEKVSGIIRNANLSDPNFNFTGGATNINNIIVHSISNETVSSPKITSEMQSFIREVSTAALETLNATIAASRLQTNATESVTDKTTGPVNLTRQDGVDQAITTTPVVKEQTTTSALTVKALRKTTTEEPLYYDMTDMTTGSIFVTEAPVAAKAVSVSNDSVIIVNEANFNSNGTILNSSAHNAKVHSMNNETTEEPLYYDMTDMTTESIFVTEAPVAAKAVSVSNDSVIIVNEANFNNNGTILNSSAHNAKVHSMNNETTVQSSSTVTLPNIMNEIQNSTVDVFTSALETLNAAEAVPDLKTNATESVTDLRMGTVMLTSHDGLDQISTAAPIVKAEISTAAPIVKALTSNATPIVKEQTTTAASIALRQTITEEIIYDDSTTESTFVIESPVAVNDSATIRNTANFTGDVTILKTSTLRENETVSEIIANASFSDPKLKLSGGATNVNNIMVLPVNNQTATKSPNVTSEIHNSTASVSTLALETLSATESVSSSRTNTTDIVTDITTGTAKLTSQDEVDKVTSSAPIVKAQTTTEAPIVKAHTTTAAPIVSAQTTPAAPKVSSQTTPAATIVRAQTTTAAPIVKVQTTDEYYYADMMSTAETPVKIT